MESLNQELIDSIKWEQRRYKIATAAMQSMINNQDKHPNYQRVAQIATNYADALIKKLKEK